MSNEKFQSVMHRAITNSSKSHMSLVFACIAVDDDVITIPEKLVDSNHPAKFIPFTWKDFRKNIYCEDWVDMYRETTRVTADDWLIWTQSVDRHVKLITFCFF